MEIVLLGHMGRDEAVADRLAGHTLHVLGQWENPGLVEKAQASGGDFHVIKSITDVERVADYVQAVEPDMFLTNFDASLGAGVVDAIRRRVESRYMRDLWIPCPNKAAARVEWDKFYLRDIIDEINPEFNPHNFMVQTSDAAKEAIEFFRDQGVEIVIKPRNLTGGKGVKVQGKHFESYDEAMAYAAEILAASDQEGLEVQEKLEGHEFTLQLFTDGITIIKAPTTYDYPYREDGDVGPGTGGMGTFSMQDGLMPFIDQADYDQVIVLMHQVLAVLRQRGLDYKGVLYPTFFKTPSGQLKIVEINARGGDPELVNIVDLMDDSVDFGEVLQRIATGELSEGDIRYKKMASAMVYLVSPDYGYRSGPSYEFGMGPSLASEFGCKVRYAATEKTGTTMYRTVGSSRSVGISSLAQTPWAAREDINSYIAHGFTCPLTLEYRTQIAQQEYIRGLVI